MNQLGIKLDTEKSNLKIQNIQENPDVTEQKRNFTKLFHENKTVKGIEVDIQLKPDAKLIQQKGRSVPIDLQPAVGKEIEKLKKRACRKSSQHRQKLLRKPSSFHRCEK